MSPTSRSLAALLAAAIAFAASSNAQTLAVSPPLGWSSWDAYGTTINEDAFKANAGVLAGLVGYGWQYAVVADGWYMASPTGKTLADKTYAWNQNGLLIPVLERFPSAAGGQGFKPLAYWLHAQGLKFGIQIQRGIPRQVVQANLPIAGTAFHASDAADTTAPCPSNEGNWGVRDNAAGQAYYDSMLRLYAGWGVDFLIVDCIAANPYRLTEIHQIAEAIRKAARPMVLSLAPGPTDLEHAGEVSRSAQMWRISGDPWDDWSLPQVGPGEFPFGILGAFDRLAKWFTYAGPGNWPDAGVLPIGWLGPSPGWGSSRQSQETHDEEQTQFTLWAVTRSPLILGANLTRLDDFTRSLITNQDLLFINQNATYSRPVDAAGLGPGFENARVWRASINEPGARGYKEYFAFFNLAGTAATLRTTWKQLGLDAAKHSAVDLWSGETGKESKDLSVTLPPHGSAVFEAR
jgi:hypothetical protein